MEIMLLRHGKTQGNLERRYVGRTDEPLCAEGISALRQSGCFGVEDVFCSPMKRCLQTAQLVFPDTPLHILSGLRETDFGIFEGKTYEELKHSPQYCAWIDSGGKSQIPGGESLDTVKKRCTAAFLTAVKSKAGRIAIVAHGGTIMALLEEYGVPKHSFYHWQVKNGEGYSTRYDRRNGTLEVLAKIPADPPAGLIKQQFTEVTGKE